jgi:NTE family protein
MRRRAFLGAMGCLPAISVAARATPAAVVSPAVPQRSAKGGPATRGRRVGIAFGGGSIHGIAHVGVLKAFAAKGLDIQFIAGTIVGAIAGRIEWPGLMSITWSGKGLMQNSKLRDIIDTALGDRTIEQLPVPFAAVATDLASGERVVIRRGTAGPAVEAWTSPFVRMRKRFRE